jgi:asparagine synthase (glutamine-hydrolysing)
LYFISRLLREHVVVALSGEGADELFGGYQIYRYMAMLERYRRMPSTIRRLALDPLLSGIGSAKLRKYVGLAQLPLEKRYLGVSLHDPSEKHALLSPSFTERVGDTGGLASLEKCYAKTVNNVLLTRMLYVDLKTWLVDDLLIKADKMTMANSVELRVPFLDYRVVEYAATIPSRMKIRGSQVKWILKRAMADTLPERILTREKRGFPTPLALMFRRDMASYLPDLLLGSSAIGREYFRRPRVEQLIREHVSGTRDHHKTLWQLVVLEEWHRRFIDGGIPADRPAGRAGVPALC